MTKLTNSKVSLCQIAITLHCHHNYYHNYSSWLASWVTSLFYLLTDQTSASSRFFFFLTIPRLASIERVLPAPLYRLRCSRPPSTFLASSRLILITHHPSQSQGTEPSQSQGTDPAQIIHRSGTDSGYRSCVRIHNSVNIIGDIFLYYYMRDPLTVYDSSCAPVWWNLSSEHCTRHLSSWMH